MKSGHEFLRTRRSVRRFRPEPVADSIIERVLETARFAPSAHHREPWRFAVLKTAETKTRLADSLGAEFRRDLAADGLAGDEIEAQVKRSRQRILAAPVIIVLCMDSSELEAYPDMRRTGAERVMGLQSVAAAGLQLLLAAHAEELGGVWVCSPLFVPQTVRATLDLPETWEPQAMFFLGFPAGIPEARARKPLEAVVIAR
jgi:coenzyme F420-0:L-glutamate ligase/coenzyme F420-1:gamma-L-glutamate ligase